MVGVEQAKPYTVKIDSERDSTRYAATMDDASLQDFFSRPVKVAEFDWAVSTVLFETINPWRAFFENTRVINRISNFNCLKADLHVKFMITGNGFHYGRALVSYTPYVGFDGFIRDRALIREDLVEASQRPHIFLDPTESLGGDMVLPFFWWDDSLSIPKQEWRDMGGLTVREINTLQHANGANDTVTITVFAWAENVELSIPTSVNPGGLTPQMGMMDDEYSSKPVSTMASTVARVAGMLSDIPIISPYARATEMISTAIGKVAQIFGFSRPAIVENHTIVNPRYGGNLANTNAGDTTQRLTVDVKQELTVDPRVTGLGGTDEMNIGMLAAKECYLTTFNWNVGESPNSVLWSSEVHPFMYAYSGVGEEFHMTPMCWAALPFKYWRGNLKFRFQIVSSVYHKGKLRISYDPYGFETDEYNVNYNTVVDMANDKDFTLKIGWGNTQHFKERRVMSETTIPYGDGDIGRADLDWSNGILKVYILNQLTVPSSEAGQQIQVNVYVSCENLEVGEPDEAGIRDWTYVPQMGVMTPQMGEMTGDVETTDEANAPEQSGVIETMAKETDVSDYTYHVYFGEHIVSLRQMLKRYMYSETFSGGLIGSAAGLVQFTTSLPLHPGYPADGIHRDGATPFNATNMTYLNWVLPAFVGWRGSLRWKILVDGSQAGSSVVAPILAVANSGIDTGYLKSETLLAYGGNDQLATGIGRLLFGSTFNGAAYTPVNRNPVLEYEVPFYTNKRFGYARDDRLVDRTFSQAQNVTISMSTFSGGGADRAYILHKFVSVGEDFSLYFYLCTPVAKRFVRP